MMESEKEEEKEMNKINDLMNNHELWAVWNTKCWKCKAKIVVAMDTGDWVFDSIQGELGVMWRNEIDERTLKILERFGVKIERRYSNTVESEYMVNVCPNCNSIQGDWFVHEELLDLVYDNPSDHKSLLLIDTNKGELIDTLNTFVDFQNKYLREKIKIGEKEEEHLKKELIKFFSSNNEYGIELYGLGIELFSDGLGVVKIKDVIVADIRHHENKFWLLYNGNEYKLTKKGFKKEGEKKWK